jgi:hypothetical protein
MTGNIKFKCPICKDGDVDVYWWSFPQTYEEPEDSGFEIVEQSCECEMTDEQINKVFTEKNKDEIEIEEIEVQNEIRKEIESLQQPTIEEKTYFESKVAVCCINYAKGEMLFLDSHSKKLHTKGCLTKEIEYLAKYFEKDGILKGGMPVKQRIEQLQNLLSTKYCINVSECEEIFVGNCVGCPHDKSQEERCKNYVSNAADYDHDYCKLNYKVCENKNCKDYGVDKGENNVDM